MDQHKIKETEKARIIPSSGEIRAIPDIFVNLGTVVILNFQIVKLLLL